MVRMPFTTSLVPAVLAIFLTAVFARLGFWQLDRAAEKNRILTQTGQSLEKPVINSLVDHFPDTVRYRQSSLAGRFDFNRQFLLDNRVHNGRPGYEVLTPFFIEEEADVILVNRGWVPQNGDRTIKPEVGDSTLIDSVAGTNPAVIITGQLVTPSKGVTLGQSIDATEIAWPLVLQYLDYQTIAEKLDRTSLFNAVLVLSEGQVWSYTHNWQPVANGPEKHYGYAFQWFAMMLAVIAFYVYLNFIKSHE